MGGVHGRPSRSNFDGVARYCVTGGVQGRISSGSLVNGAFFNGVDPMAVKNCTSKGETTTSSKRCFALPVPIDNLEDLFRNGRPGEA